MWFVVSVRGAKSKKNRTWIRGVVEILGTMALHNHHHGARKDYDELNFTGPLLPLLQPYVGIGQCYEPVNSIKDFFIGVKSVIMF